jgi:hypothetical protein
MSKIDKNEMLKVLQNGYYSTIKLAETVHFNPKYPENQNIYITNMKNHHTFNLYNLSQSFNLLEQFEQSIMDCF